MHIDQAVETVRLIAVQQDGVGVAHDSDMAEARVFIGFGEGQGAGGVVGGKRRVVLGDVPHLFISDPRPRMGVASTWTINGYESIAPGYDRAWIFSNSAIFGAWRGFST